MTSLASRAWGRVRRSLRLPGVGIERAVQLFGAAHPDAFFVQVGANDGLALDPLRIEINRRSWRGIMVEPVPYVFKRLQDRYGQEPRIILEQAAVADRDGTLPFYHLREASPGDQVWDWYHALGSFKREVVLRHRELIPDIEARLIETHVRCVTFTSLCRKHEVHHVDLLQLDTEGYDYEILRTMELETWRPRLIIYEHHHLAAEERAAARGLLEHNDYVCFEHGLDTAALNLTRLDAADERLRALFEATPDAPAAGDVR